jgi:predicted ATP-grasp superfamily ATP-dependent carboligase
MLFAHKRIRSLSPRGGAAVVKETASHTGSIDLMQKYAEMLVSALSWTGPVMVEFKIDDKDGRVLLMEINGRFWGSLPLAVKAGSDFPYATFVLAHNEMKKLEAFSSAIVRTRHFLGDCAWLMRVLFAKDPLRSRLYPSRIHALWDFKTEMFRSTGDIFSIKDLKPSIFEYIDILHKWKSKA